MSQQICSKNRFRSLNFAPRKTGEKKIYRNYTKEKNIIEKTWNFNAMPHLLQK